MLLNELMVARPLVLHAVGFYFELFAPRVASTHIPQYGFPRTFLHLGRELFYIFVYL